ncbi:MAG: ribosomal protein S18-alanine N-acetyltransferase [Clostridia bacterium]|nr:ribosomal protein S18-alanine N-acetyltransferase [Clostridia bacterium]
MTLREICVSDKETLAAAKDFGFTDGWNESMITSAFNGGNFYGFIAEDNAAMGFVTYTQTVDFAEIADLFVFPDYRRKGIAVKLLGEVINAVKNAGKEKIFLEVRKGNLAAKNLYSKLGFTELYERKKYYGDEDATVMVKEI